MDIFEAIRVNHEQLRDLLDKLESVRGPKAREKNFVRLRDEMVVHNAVEERVFYPTLLDEKDAREEALEAIEEHNVIAYLLADLEETPADDERWKAKLTVLHELFEHHVEEEEQEIFDTMQEILSDEETDEMGKEYQAEKDAARAQKKLPVEEEEDLAPRKRKGRSADDDEEDEFQEEEEEPDEEDEEGEPLQEELEGDVLEDEEDEEDEKEDR